MTTGYPASPVGVASEIDPPIVSNDPTLGGGTPSATLAPSQSAVQEFAALAVQGLLRLKGDLDCSANPNYPAGVVGDTYLVTVAGRVGGASGKPVDAGDNVVCKAINAGGTEAAVGTSWFALEHNTQGISYLEATEALSAGDFVNIWTSGGVAKIRKATNTAAGTESSGFVQSAVSLGATGTVYGLGRINMALSGLTAGSTYYLGTSGGVTATAPSSAGNVVQQLGKATGTTAIQLNNLFSVVLA
jgi:hypothetical protein